MKTLILSAALTLAASQWAVAADFTYERQIASEDLASETSGLVYAARDPQPSGGDLRTSLDTVIQDNPDSSDSLPPPAPPCGRATAAPACPPAMTSWPPAIPTW